MKEDETPAELLNELTCARKRIAELLLSGILNVELPTGTKLPRRSSAGLERKYWVGTSLSF